MSPHPKTHRLPPPDAASGMFPPVPPQAGRSRNPTRVSPVGKTDPVPPPCQEDGETSFCPSGPPTTAALASDAATGCDTLRHDA